MLGEFYERKAEENAEDSARWEERKQWIRGSPREAYKKGYKEAHSKFRSPSALIFPLISMAILGYLFVEKDLHYFSRMNSVHQQNQAKQQRIIDFYQRHGDIPEGVSPAYLDLRTQLWQREVEGGQ